MYEYLCTSFRNDGTYLGMIVELKAKAFCHHSKPSLQDQLSRADSSITRPEGAERSIISC